MKLDSIRSLEGQLLAIACLFVACIPISGAVIFLRPKFERAMSEAYTASSAAAHDELKQLAAQLEDPAADPTQVHDAIVKLAAPEKEWLYQDWVTHPEPERVITVARLIEADPDYFLHRAEQTVVCGSEDQQKLGLRFLALSEHPSVAVRLQHLLRWTRQRHLPDAPDRIQSVLTDWVASHPKTPKSNEHSGSIP
ncbi:MAG: hypothetical protein JNM43_24135 [Planctomycetaceae bacterium]|nr:hypothetical protein [Planctomycetaceae bacterium]